MIPAQGSRDSARNETVPSLTTNKVEEESKGAESKTLFKPEISDVKKLALDLSTIEALNENTHNETFG